MKRDKLPDGRLGELLSSAAAPPRRHELRGEEDAVAGFRQEYRPRPAKPARRKRRLLAVVAAALFAVGVGGTAFAANTGHLPAPVQMWFDTHTGTNPDKTPVSTMSPQQSPAASPKPTPSASSAAADECRAWVARRTDPASARPITPAEKDQLTRLAGSEPAIDTYCDRLLGTAPSSAPPSKSPPSPSTSKNRSPGEDDQGEDENNPGKGVTTSG